MHFVLEHPPQRHWWSGPNLRRVYTRSWKTGSPSKLVQPTKGLPAHQAPSDLSQGWRTMVGQSGGGCPLSQGKRKHRHRLIDETICRAHVYWAVEQWSTSRMHILVLRRNVIMHAWAGHFLAVLPPCGGAWDRAFMALGKRETGNV